MKKILIAIVLCLSTSTWSQISIKEIKKIGVDKNMTDETALYLQNLHNIRKTLIGQHDGVWLEENAKINSHITGLTNKYPSIVSYDFMFITHKYNKHGTWHRTQEHFIREKIVAANRSGIYITMCWHYNEPYERYSFYTKEMKSEEQVKNAFRSIMKGGENHEQYKKDLHKIAEFSGTLKDDNGKLIPILFRPFHEFDGEWFWWGAPYNTPDEFKDTWKFTVSYLRDTLGVHNMLYAFSPDIRFDSREDFLLRYPGNEYVDVIGFDDYEDFKYDLKRTEQAKKRIKILAELGKDMNKPVGLTETGYFIRHSEQKEIDLIRTKNLLKTLSEMHQYLDFIIFWANGGSWDYCVPPPGTLGEAEFKEFLNQTPLELIDTQ